MISRQKLIDLIEGHLAGGDLFLVEAVVKPGNRIMVFVDGDHGVTIERCRELNHFLNLSLDRDLEDYDLTVSSSGADRPLTLPRQFVKNTGKELDVILHSGQKLRGVVARAGEDRIELAISPAASKKKRNNPTDEKTMDIPYGDIRKATEVVTFKS